jgi:hypothetical protein
METGRGAARDSGSLHDKEQLNQPKEQHFPYIIFHFSFVIGEFNFQVQLLDSLSLQRSEMFIAMADTLRSSLRRSETAQ